MHKFDVKNEYEMIQNYKNLLLASISATPLMKIGDFGFARSLTPLQLADTLCGSPYYMASGIIQSHMMPR
ncbi:Protein kinase superfamily protein [Trifolium repens]|nr:Protein kinase superfamily protein [Trifolium repens]